MKRVPFIVDDLKLKYIDGIATQYLFDIQNMARNKNITPIFKKNVKRVKVTDVQDLFIVEYICEEINKKIIIEKFFLPNSIFTKYYYRDMELEAQKSLILNGKKVINNLLLWGRLIVN